jgi:phospholipid/cholesterol/gamma-HCH transport system substrate-binding protein
MKNLELSRVAAVAALVAVVVIAVLTLGGGDAYTIKARFVDAGQVVKGGLVQISGRPVGKIADIRLTSGNEAELVLKITEDSAKPLRRGTVATIRTVGLSGVTNRYVELTPGPDSGAEIEDGGILHQPETRPIVDLDTLLNTLDEPTRNKLQGIIKDGDKIFDGTAEDANKSFGYLNPAVAQGGALAEELATDTAAVGRLLTTGAVVAKTLASRQGDVSSGITSTAATLRALADERTSLESILQRAPGTLRQARTTLRNTRAALTEFRPRLRELRPVAGPAADLLRKLGPVSRQARPVIEDVNDLLPALRAALVGLPGLRDVAIPALKSTTSAITQALPLARGLRPYGSDVVLGLSGLGGRASMNYDANGHFTRVAFVGFGGAGSTGLLGSLPGLDLQGGTRSGLTARCPGSAAAPAADGSNPDIPDASICNHDHDPKP